MLTLRQILKTQSGILENSTVKIVRHKDNRQEYRHISKDRVALLEYQKEQASDIFGECDYIVSFIGTERRKSVFIGVFKVGQHTERNGKIYYELEQVPEFDDLVDRVVIDWGNNAISWHQWYHRQEKEVVEILPEGYIGNFPGLLQIVLEFSELKRLVANPNSNHEWFHHLSAVNGVYMILDAFTGMQYIGSAYGKEGIWQRWSEYAKTITGGNKELKELIAKDPDYHRHFRFSVLQTLPSNVTKDEIIRVESLYKNKLGSRVFGLNSN